MLKKAPFWPQERLLRKNSASKLSAVFLANTAACRPASRWKKIWTIYLIEKLIKSGSKLPLHSAWVFFFFFFFFFFFNGVFLLRLRCSSDDRKRVRRACDTVLCDSVVTRRNVKGEGECFIFHRGSGSPINAFKNLFKGGLKIFMKLN